jgi:hypothetical protein
MGCAANMINLSEISDEVRIARGDYSTVRAAHEDAKKSMQMLCGQLSSLASRMLRKMQPDNDEIPGSVAALISGGHDTLVLMEACAQQIESLAQQRADLKPAAWGKQPF